MAKLERVAPPEFGGDLETLEKMLVDAVEGPHPEWTPQDLEDMHNPLVNHTPVSTARTAAVSAATRTGSGKSEGASKV